MLPINLLPNVPGTPIAIANDSNGAENLAIAPDGHAAYVTTIDAVVPIDLVTDTLGKPIAVPQLNRQGSGPIEITTDGKAAYVTFGETVLPIDLLTNTPGTPIALPQFARYWS